jgi:predicted DNA-binding transcriptional regulator YafY
VHVLQTSARLLRLLSLLQARRYWTGSELAEQLEVTPRTLRRDVDRLRSLGYPVDSTSGTAGGYRLGAGAAMPPLLLDDDEAMAVSVGLRTAAGGTISGMEEAAVRALAKLEQVLPARLRRRAAALHSHIVPLSRPGPTIAPAVLSTIAGACRDREKLTFVYRDRNSAASERSVEPHGLVHTGSRWYLVAWDGGRADWRTFRVDRIQAPLTPAARFMARPIPGGDLAAYVSRQVSSDQYAFRALVLLHAPIERIAERVSPCNGSLEAIDGQRCLLQTGGHSLDALAMWIAMLGVDFEVRDPPELVDHLRKAADRLRRAAVRVVEDTAPRPLPPAVGDMLVP